MGTDHDEEGLYFNPIYRQLVSRIDDFQLQATKLRWVICLPHSSTLKDVEPSAIETLSDQQLHQHVLVPSQLVKEEYDSLGGQRLTISNGNLNLSDAKV